MKLMKGKALRKHSLHEKTAASFLLKLFISGSEVHQWSYGADKHTLEVQMDEQTPNKKAI